MANEFPEAFLRLEEMGVLDSLLPFILIFTIIFAVLQKTHIIGEGKKQFNTLVALVLSLMVVIPHLTGRYPPGQDVVTIINTALPQVSLVVVAILALLLVIGVFAPGVMLSGTAVGAGFAIFSIIAIIYIFGNAAGVWTQNLAFLGFLNDPDTQAMLIMIAAFFLIIWFITRDDNNQTKTGKVFGKIFDEFKNIIPGPK